MASFLDAVTLFDIFIDYGEWHTLECEELGEFLDVGVRQYCPVRVHSMDFVFRT